MNDDIDSMSKEDLLAMAELHAVEVDGRWSAARIREALRDKVGFDATPVAEIELIKPADVAADAGAFNLDGIVSAWADSWVNRLVRAWATFEDGGLTVSVETAHGLSTTTIAGISDTPDSVKAALDLARLIMIGDPATETERN